MANLPIKVFEDNAAAIRYGINPSSQSTMKYFELDMLLINDSIRRGELELVKIETKNHLADIDIKFTVTEIFFYIRSNLNMCIPVTRRIHVVSYTGSVFVFLPHVLFMVLVTTRDET